VVHSCRVVLRVGLAPMTDDPERREPCKGEPPPLETEPRWPALVALLAVSSLSAALPASLAVIPRWYGLGGVAVLLVPTIMTHHRGQHARNQQLGYVVNGVVTAAMVSSWVLLLRGVAPPRLAHA
jgi:hypothetical protein